MSIGVWVGLIALMGVDAETGVFMLLYLDLAYEELRAEGRLTKLRRICGRRFARRGQAHSSQVHDRGDACSSAWPPSCGRRAPAPT